MRFRAALSVFEQERKDPKAVDEMLSVVDALYAHEVGNDYQMHNARPVEDRKADAFIAGATKGAPAAIQDERAGKTVVNLRFDARLLARIDAAARRQGISRTAWLHVAASKALEA
jgi:hypothetical protein